MADVMSESAANEKGFASEEKPQHYTQVFFRFDANLLRFDELS